MTEITRSIEIAVPRDKVWSAIRPENWTRIFDFVREVNGHAAGEAGVGTKAEVVAGEEQENPVRYSVEITEYIEREKIVYKRYGGPLIGKGVIQLKSLNTGTLLKRTSYYDDALTEDTIQALSLGMERDNLRIKTTIEGGN